MRERERERLRERERGGGETSKMYKLAEEDQVE
jgi:hypothetical protein